MSLARVLTSACLALAPAAVFAQPAPTADGGMPPLLERQKEIALALSACPPHVADKAAVYVLERSGYVKAREGQNGFTALVNRTVPTAVEPECLDAEGTRSFLPWYLKRAELRARGMSRHEVKKAMDAAWANGTFQPPGPGVDYMLSTENVVTIDEEKGVTMPFPPHLMFYFPNKSNADLGSDGSPTSHAFVVDEGTPHALIIVPVGAHAGHAPAADKQP